MGSPDNWGFRIFFLQANVGNLPNLPNWPNWPWSMKESIHLIGGLLGHVSQHDLFKYICPNLETSQMCDLKSSNGWTLMVLHSFNGWTQIV